MKLLHYTYRNLFLFLLAVFSLWGALFYYTMLEEIIDETDDALKNYRNILVNTALKDPSILETEGNLMAYYKFRPIEIEEAVDYKERFFDSTIYIEIEDEWEPVRVMKSCFMMPDGLFYEIELMISTVEREDMIEAIFGYLISLFVLLLLCFAIITRVVLKRSFRPLDKLVNWLDNIQPGKEVAPLENGTGILEFKKLSDAAVDMSNRSHKAYLGQKQFIENASHELQTPLAILRAKVELLAETDGLSEEQMKELSDMYNTLGRAVKLNKSLLLLSRIENGQYIETVTVLFNDIIKSILVELQDIFDWKNIRFIEKEDGEFSFQCNYLLARILIANLVKNAMSHSPQNGVVEIVIDQSAIYIKNTGNNPLDKEKIFQRFYHDPSNQKESIGLGLAIAKTIANSYGLVLDYNWSGEGKHVFTIRK